MHRRAFKLLEMIDGEAPVAGASGDHDGARLDPLAGRELHVTRVVAAFELDGFVGDQDLDPELLRLTERAAHQGHAGNSRRKAEIIFDSRGRARLAAE